MLFEPGDHSSPPAQPLGCGVESCDRHCERAYLSLQRQASKEFKTQKMCCSTLYYKISTLNTTTKKLSSKHRCILWGRVAFLTIIDKAQ